MNPPMRRANYAELQRAALGRGVKTNTTPAKTTKTTTTTKPAPAAREKEAKTMKKGKRGKLHGAAKAAFLARMNAGRRKAGIAPIGRKGGGHKPGPRAAAASRARGKARPKVTVKSARVGKSHPGRRGGGKMVPVNVKLQVNERQAPKRGGGHRGRGRRRNPAIYENPMTGTEAAVGALFCGVGIGLGRAVDRWMATRPIIAALNPAAGAATPAVLSLSDAVNSAPGIARAGVQVVLGGLPLLGSFWAPPMLRAGLQGAAIGVFGNLIAMGFEHYVLVKMLAPKNGAGALQPIGNGGQLTAGQTPPTMIQRLYNDEITADADRATAAAAGGTVAGLPAPRTAIRALAGGVDPGPRAVRRQGVAGAADATGQPPGGCSTVPDGVPAAVNTDLCPPGREPPVGAPVDTSGGMTLPPPGTIATPPSGSLGELPPVDWNAFIQASAA